MVFFGVTCNQSNKITKEGFRSFFRMSQPKNIYTLKEYEPISISKFLMHRCHSKSNPCHYYTHCSSKTQAVVFATWQKKDLLLWCTIIIWAWAWGNCWLFFYGSKMNQSPSVSASLTLLCLHSKHVDLAWYDAHNMLSICSIQTEYFMGNCKCTLRTTISKAPFYIYFLVWKIKKGDEMKWEEQHVHMQLHNKNLLVCLKRFMGDAEILSPFL